MQAFSKKIVLCGGVRTPIGHIARSLARIRPEELMKTAVQSLLQKTSLDPEKVSGIVVGWVGQSFSAPNIARVTALKAGLPEKVQSVTVQNNCVSSIESVSAAARFILAGEGDLYVAGGTESMSQFPYSFRGSRDLKQLRSLDALKSKWTTLLQDPDVAVIDSIEEGLTDPVKQINMAGTAEVCAQIYGISRETQDVYARESYRRCIDGWKSGFYKTHVNPFQQDGAVRLEKDEYPFLREELVAKPEMFAKAPLAFDNSSYSIQDFYNQFGQYMDGKKYESGKTKGTVTLFNSCARSDGATAVIVTTEEKAAELRLPILAEIKSWGFYGNNPAHMGVSPALAAPVALERAGLSFDQLDQIELHEPFAATVLSLFKVGKERFKHDWESKFKSGALNPNGGSIAMGHPLGATGIRLLLNLLYALQSNPKSRYGMIAACAGGGMGGTLIVEKRET
ncbi:MAG: thiolase family protein [Elusimicrobia bacterium]|nr:thiolase family protein [Elusimicrobiota bacterium]